MSQPKVLIGAPIYNRAYILPNWLAAIEKQTIALDQLGFVFELAPNDEPTHNILWEWHQRHPEVSVFDGAIREDIKHESHPANGRTWTALKYEKMCLMRNSLLDRAICIQPDRYFSLDSDIILENPNTIQHLYDLTETLDAVSPLSYMKPDPDKEFPSVMTWVGNTARRLLHTYPLGELFQSDVIMAVKMMSRPVYETTRYYPHKQGEDLGWSIDATRQGFKLWCASYLYGAHVMHESRLKDYLEKGDSRSTNVTLAI